METVLFARFKAVAARIVFPLLLVGLILFVSLRHDSLSQEEIRTFVADRISVIEKKIAVQVKKQLLRSQQVFELRKSGALKDDELQKGEAIFTVEKEAIREYRGNIFYFKIEPLAESEWRLINKNQGIYFFRRLSRNLYYINFFLDGRDNFIERSLQYPFSSSDLKFFPTPQRLRTEEFQYNAPYRQYFYQHVLLHLQGHFLLELVFTQKDIEQTFAKRKRLSVLFLLLFLFATLIFYCFRRRSWPFLLARVVLLGGIAWTLSSLFSLVTQPDIFLPTAFFRFSRIHQVLALVLFLFFSFYSFRRNLRFQLPLTRLLLANALLLGVCQAGRRLVTGVNFVFSDFAFRADYLSLVLILIILFASPLIVLGEGGTRISTRKLSLLLALQLLSGALFWSLGQPVLVIGSAFSLFIALHLLLGNRLWLGLLRLALIAFAVNQFVTFHVQLEKKEFVQNNLKMILSSQNHYAMLVAREIVYEINSRQNPPFNDLFGPSGERELKGIWNATLAAKEMIPSGIFVLSAQGELIHSFSDQPLIKVDKKNRFPFWHEEEVEADLYGKKLNLALATISVFEGEEFRGDIMVQVVNSPDLILRNLDQTTIFTIDQKIRDCGISYIKLNQERQILQNPANINVENIASLVQGVDRWIRFQYMGITYRGYVFLQNENVILIFFPEPTVFKKVSEWIKVFCFVLLLYMLFNVHRLRGFDWKLYFGSFSMKVFFILIMIAMLTATVFSLFSLNFHFPALEQQLVQAAYEKGRIAQNMVYNLISEKSELRQNDVFMLSKVLDNNITLYEKGELQYSSDNRKIILSQIPIYLPSKVKDYLRENALLLDMAQNAQSVQLYSKISPDYVLAIEFFYNTADQVRAKKYYVDFIITLFFFLFLIGIASALFFRNKILAPIKALNQGMAEVEKGNLTPLPEIPRDIELKSLYTGFNSMVAGIEEQKKSILELARMKTMIQLSRRLAHEIKNPLTPIQLSAEQISRSMKDKKSSYEETIEKSVKYIIEETEHLRKVALGFLDLSKLEKLEKSRFDLGELIRQEVSNLQPLYPRIRFTLDVPQGPLTVHADRIKIKQALGNVLANAVEACECIVLRRSDEKREALWKRNLAIDVAARELDRQVEIVVSDNGSGMKAGDLALIFAENFSTKETGTGLGLIIVKRIVELHKGGLEIDSRENEKTVVRMRFAKDVPEA